jgi:two-component system, NtrC family, sensor kinase
MSNCEPLRESPLEEVEQLRVRVRELEDREREQQRAQEHLEEYRRMAALSRDVSIALIQSSTLQESLQRCTQALVTHLGAAFARIWTLNADNAVLELQASAGIYTHLDGLHSRVPVGTLKIGLIASERQPHLTNAVIGDPRSNDTDGRSL